MVLAHAARLPGNVRMTQATHEIAGGCVVADVRVEVPAERTLATCAMADTATDLMRRGPYHLSEVAYGVMIVPLIVTVLVILDLHKPHSDGEVPECPSCRNEDVLSTLA